MNDDPVRELLHLYEDGAFSRREILRRLRRYTGSAAAATAALAGAGLLHAEPGGPNAVQVPEDAPDLVAERLAISGEGPLYVYQVRPIASAGAARPAVIVIHENAGVTPYIEDVTRRLGRAGYVALAVDLLSRQGGTAQFPDPQQATQAYNRTRPEERRADLLAALGFLRDQPYARADRVAAIGFCAGGGNCYDLALNADNLAAAVLFYPTPLANFDQVARIRGPLLAVFGALDRNTTARVSDLVTALLANNKTFGIHVYENANHAFHNDTGTRYNEEAAGDAWGRTLAFFGRHLGL